MNSETMSYDQLQHHVGCLEQRIEELTEERDTESKAAAHWMGEANESHNTNVKLQAMYEDLRVENDALVVALRKLAGAGLLTAIDALAELGNENETTKVQA